MSACLGELLPCIPEQSCHNGEALHGLIICVEEFPSSEKQVLTGGTLITYYMNTHMLRVYPEQNL